MVGKIIKVHPLRESKNGNSFIRIEFELLGGAWAKTDICPDFKNYKRWQKPLEIGEGAMLAELEMRDDSTINADSPVRLLNER